MLDIVLLDIVSTTVWLKLQKGFWNGVLCELYTYIVSMVRALKDDSNHTNYTKSPKFDLQGFRNKSTMCQRFWNSVW